MSSSSSSISSLSGSGYYQLPENVKLPQDNPFKEQSADYHPLFDDDASDQPLDLQKEKDKAGAAANAKVQRTLKKYAQKGIKQVVGKTLGHLAPGSSGLLSGFAAYSTHRHLKRLSTLADKECSNPADVPSCKGTLAYVVHQKERKRRNAVVKMLPLIGEGQAAVDMGHGAVKRVKGTRGKSREAEAELLVSHARNGCTVAGAIFVEITVGDYRKQDNWTAGLKLLGTQDAASAANEKMASTA